MKKNIIIGAAGSGTAFAAITSLRKNWGDDVYVVGLDTNPRHLVTATLLVDKLVQMPPASEPSFLEELLKEASSCGESLFMPLLPEELLAFQKYGTRPGQAKSLKVIGIEPGDAASVLDKLVLFQRAQAAGITCPKTEPASVGMTYSSGCLLKPRLGYGSRGVHRSAEGKPCMGPESPENYIVQDFINGPELTVDAFYQRSTGFAWSVCRERLEVKSGVSVKCRLFRDVFFDEMAQTLANTFKLNGAFCFQVIQSKRGPVLIDLNPRPGAGTSMSTLTGNDFFAAGFSLAFNEEFKRHFTPVTQEAFVTRQYVDFLS